jgi:hypothetical protein
MTECALFQRSGLFAGAGGIRDYGVMVRDGANAPPHHEEDRLERNHEK